MWPTIGGHLVVRLGAVLRGFEGRLRGSFRLEIDDIVHRIPASLFSPYEWPVHLLGALHFGYFKSKAIIEN